MTRNWQQPFTAGMAPPALLRARAIEAEEVLVLTYTADLRFFERVGLGEARAAKARVTIVHDIAADLTNPADVKHAGIHYTDVPVRCRSGGEFHPKLLVIAGHDRAIVAIGSGNATASGWHHNGELWTTMLADDTAWPDTFLDLANWLENLPTALFIDPLGEARLAATAALLRRHPPSAQGPALLHNLNSALLEQLPRPATGTTHVTIGSPFLDSACSALTDLTTRFDPDTITLALTRNANADPDAIATWAQSRPGTEVRPIDAARYHHGKLIQWSGRDDTTTALVGSANVTRAALLRTTSDQWGNCELGLLCENSPDLTPPLGQRIDLDHGDKLDDLIRPRPNGESRDETAPRLLRVTREIERCTITLVCDAAHVYGAALITATSSSALQLDQSDGRLHQLHANAVLAPGTLCHIELAGGQHTAQVRITDIEAVLARPGAGSPLDDHGISGTLCSQTLTRKLLDALLELAEARPDDTSAGQAHRSWARGAWRHHGERIAGSALITLALGRHSSSLTGAGFDGEPANSEHDLGDFVSESQDDEGEPTLFDDEETDTGVKNTFDRVPDPISALAADPISAGRLAAAIDRCRENLDNWNPVAILALLRLAFIVAAADGWGREDAAWTITMILNALGGAQEEGDTDLAEARDAAFLVGLAIIREAIDDWDKIPDSLPDWLEHLRVQANIKPDALSPSRIEHYAADLHITYGSTLTKDALIDASPYLLATSALERALEDFENSYPGLSLLSDRCVAVPTNRPALPTALRLLDALHNHAPLAVRVIGTDSLVHAAWQPKQLTIQRFTVNGTPTGGSTHNLMVRPGAHRSGRLPPPVKRWHGDLPAQVRASMAQDGVDLPSDGSTGRRAVPSMRPAGQAGTGIAPAD